MNDDSHPQCPSCGIRLSDDYSACPKCSYPLKKLEIKNDMLSIQKSRRRTWFAVGLIATGFALLGLLCFYVYSCHEHHKPLSAVELAYITETGGVCGELAHAERDLSDSINSNDFPGLLNASGRIEALNQRLSCIEAPPRFRKMKQLLDMAASEFQLGTRRLGLHVAKRDGFSVTEDAEHAYRGADYLEAANKEQSRVLREAQAPD